MFAPRGLILHLRSSITDVCNQIGLIPDKAAWLTSQADDECRS